jgi:hypothetical protein
MKYTLTIETDNEDELRSVTERLSGAPTTKSTAKTETKPEAPKTEAETKSDEASEIPDVDASGFPYDPELHHETFKANGEWKVKKGQADADKEARAAWKAQGGNVEAPEIEETVETKTEAPKMPGMPTQNAEKTIPASKPVSIDEVFAKIGEMFEAKTVDEVTVTGLYTKITGTANADEHYELFSTNETMRSQLMAELEQIELDADK